MILATRPDRADNDGDGSTDCADADCAGDPACQAAQEVCGNGLDDGDGLIDCGDPDCAADPACAGQADCNVTGCAAGLDCCPGSGACYDPRCLGCCMQEIAASGASRWRG